MRKSLSGYYRPTEEEFSELWANCMFIFDSNVLLNMYRYSQEARNDLLKILKAVSLRIWIPYQVAIEYQENRLNEIAEQVRRFSEVRNLLDANQNKLKGELEAKQLTKRPSAIKVGGFIKNVDRIFTKFKNELGEIERSQPDVTADDNIRDEIDSLFEGRVGARPSSQADLDKIYEEGQIRYQRGQPPGYMDKKKADAHEKGTYSYGGLLFKKEYGDLIIWNQIINQAKDNRDFKKIIFITDDSKEDWWWQVESKGKMTIGPRPELVEEIKSKADVLLFYMYNPEKFMQYAEQYLGIKVEKKSIEQVRDQSTEQWAATELSNIQSAVVAMMVDNNISTLPVPVAVATNDMAAFPDATAAIGTQKIKSPTGANYSAGDKAGYILFTHDIIADGGATGLVNYVATQTTKGTYTVNAQGTVTQVTTGY